jgi:hypothetical protein
MLRLADLRKSSLVQKRRASVTTIVDRILQLASPLPPQKKAVSEAGPGQLETIQVVVQ